ncbi:type 2 lanthipeptide synthetase LanM family protein [Amycolatopsis oliviviridis]|uniref:Lanthionine synthetase n=1 Tax=Amycolatopsis oliviviridis TaxID=1471590 RepID=A0ABQ3LUL2_9PSEU|nr:type 2 lanthipeptide synthetase LanM family protein [Amycolatopsis oliviviridis]GHH24488.1 lanthionine synthetase [Amycolatopsis oliviviridis]
MRLDDSSWYRALSLTERLPADSAGPSGDHGPRRLDRWRAQRPFDREDWFARRLASDGITEAELGALLGEDDDGLRDRLPIPPWLADLGVYTDADRGDDEEPRGFAVLAEPLLRDARVRVRAELDRLAADGGPVDPGSAAELVRTNVEHGVAALVERTLVLELNVARVRGELDGDTAADRYRAFLRRLREPATIDALFTEYPLLGRLLSEHVERRALVLLEFLRRLTEDWPDIRELFFADDPGTLTALAGDVGDRHRGGRAVLIASFTGGDRLVYKPKSLAIDWRFQQLLRWLNTKVDRLELRAFAVLDRGEYGWTEFVEHQPCPDERQVARFYRRLGGQLALVYALGGTDLHHENLIASGEHPMVVDLESLFQPDLSQLVDASAADLGKQVALDSVLRVGLLPQRAWGYEDAPGVDISGLGNAEEQLTPRASPYWAAAGTDEMRIERKRMKVGGGRNRPTLRGAAVDVLDHAEDLLGGFRDTYRALSADRDELIEAGGWLDRFADDEIRVILRPTHLYSLLLRESVHPDLLRDGLDRERFFDKLWVPVEYSGFLRAVIAAERAELWRGDVPMFVARPSSRDVWSGSGERLPDLLDRPGLDRVRERIAGFSEGDLEWQSWVIRGSLTALAIGDPAAKTARPGGGERSRIGSTGDHRAAAEAVGDRLERLAIRHTEGVSWLGLTAFREKYWDLAPLGADLYSGLSGIALFLAYLGDTVGEDRYTELAEGALASVRYRLDRREVEPGQLGAYSGWSSTVYLYTHLGVLWRRPELLDEAVGLAAWLDGLIDEDDQLDVLGGAAGCIAALAGLYRHRPDERLLEVIRHCGAHLLGKARPIWADLPASVGTERREEARLALGWVTPLAPRPLTGFAHGSAGIGWALAIAAEATGNVRFTDAAVAAFAHERALYQPARGNWPDLREDGTGEPMTAWCHGAVGIGLGRLALPAALRDPETSVEIAHAAETTVDRGFGANHSLCHGDLGGLELLMAAGHAAAGERSATVLKDIETNGRRCGVPNHAETPGLMTGLAGIGYGLLRAADPTRIPSVLTLEPPA